MPCGRPGRPGGFLGGGRCWLAREANGRLGERGWLKEQGRLKGHGRVDVRGWLNGHGRVDVRGWLNGHGRLDVRGWLGRHGRHGTSRTARPAWPGRGQRRIWVTTTQAPQLLGVPLG